jgi:G3E family GTPase
MIAGVATLPVIVLTGFLGSGKTTALAHLLRDERLANSAVIVNEFGEVGLDHGLIEAIDQDVVLLPQGCVCCALSGDLAATLEKLALRRDAGLVPPFERVIVETTGLADPAPVIQTIIDRPAVLCGYRLGSVLTTIDAVNALRTLEGHAEARRQAAVADRLLVTKRDLVDDAGLRAVEAALRALNPLAALDVVRDGAIDPAFILGAERDATAFPLPPIGTDPTPMHGAHVMSLVVRFADPISYAALAAWIGQLVLEHGDALLRVKGVVALAGQAQPIAIHGVQHLFHPPRRLSAWPAGVTRSTIVFILDGMDAAIVAATAAAHGLQPA